MDGDGAALQDLSDGGYPLGAYFRQVLHKLRDPRTGNLRQIGLALLRHVYSRRASKG